MASADILPPPTRGNLPRVDKLDLRILLELDKDGFQSLSKLGKKLKIGRDVIHYRVKRLEKIGIIRKYITNIDYSKLGYLIAVVYLKLRHDSPNLKKEILNYYEKREEVWWLFEMEGHYDIAFAWYAKSVPELREKYRELIEKYAKYIQDSKFRFFNKFYHFHREYLFPEQQIEKTPEKTPGKNKQKNNFFVLEANPKKITGKTDDKILEILSENARLDYISIAKKLKLTAAQVHYRIKKLKENKVILGARPLLDLDKLGLTLYKLDIYLDDYSIYNKLLNFAISHPNIVYAYDAFGGADIEIDIESRNYEEFKDIEDKIKENFHQAIEKTDFIIFLKEYKLKYFPNV